MKKVRVRLMFHCTAKVLFYKVEESFLQPLERVAYQDVKFNESLSCCIPGTIKFLCHV